MKPTSEAALRFCKTFCILLIDAYDRAAGIDYAAIDPRIPKLLQEFRESAFEAGWYAREQWMEREKPEAPAAEPRVLETVDDLEDDDDRAWVDPLAVVEHTATGELFVDPLFTISPAPSDRCCIELAMTATGLIARGPADRHRLSPEIDRERLRPLTRFDKSPAR